MTERRIADVPAVPFRLGVDREAIETFRDETIPAALVAADWRTRLRTAQRGWPWRVFAIGPTPPVGSGVPHQREPA